MRQTDKNHVRKTAIGVILHGEKRLSAQKNTLKTAFRVKKCDVESFSDKR